MKSKIIGDGDIASVLKECNKEDLLFFASGVSNSQETRESEYEKEISLLFSQLLNEPPKHLVYFSSLCVFYSDTRYARHKLHMEGLIKKNFKHYTIIRLGNINWGTNPNTLINSLRAKKQRGEPFEIQDTYRYIIDKDEFLYWMNMIPKFNCEMNVVGRRMTVKQIVEEFI